MENVRVPFSLQMVRRAGVLFVWGCQANAADIKGGCVDNIYIKPTGGCPMPTDLAAEVIGDQGGIDLAG